MILMHITAYLSRKLAEWKETIIYHRTSEWEIYHYNYTVQRHKLNHICRLYEADGNRSDKLTRV